MPLTAPRLPGLRFETVRPPVPPGLPRMDVAAFVGFASAGPVGVPVAVDDEVRFRQVFGPDLPLAWDRERGETVYAHLAPAVREFFRNGGRRCWIVRVANEASLEAASFRVPGMLHGRGRSIGAAYLLASSAGSWADGMSLNATLQSVLVSGVEEEKNGVRLEVESRDLLRIEWPDEDAVAFFPPHPGSPEHDASRKERKENKVRLFSHAYWFRAVDVLTLAESAFDPEFLAGPRVVPLDTADEWRAGNDGASLEIPLDAEVPGLQPGCWIRVLQDGGKPGGKLPSGGEASGVFGEFSVLARPGGNLASGGQASGVFAEFSALAKPGGNPGGGNPGGGNPGDGNPGGGNPGGGNPGGGSPGGGTPGGGSPGGGNPGGGSPGGGNPGGGSPGGGNPGGGNPGGGGPGGGGPGGGNPGDGKPPKDPALLGKRAYLLVDDVRHEDGRVILVVRQAWRTMHHTKAWKTLRDRRAQASLVSLELWTRRADGSVVRLPDVGLVPGHPRFLGSLPPDQVLYAPAEQLTQSTTDPLHTELSLKRFQLAAPDPESFAVAEGGAVRVLTREEAAIRRKERSKQPKPGDDDTSDGRDDDEGDGSGGFQAYLPLGVPTVLRDDFYQGAYTSGRSALERDGVGEFSAGLFLDEKLANESAGTLLDTAFFNAYVADPPLRPVRMHALLPVEEVSLLAIPDAVHTGWAPRDADVPPPAPPAPAITQPIAQPDPEGRITVRWSETGGARGYTLQDSPDPRFRHGVRSTETVAEPEYPGTHVTVIRPRPCPARLYFRVRARTAVGVSAWSPAALLDLPRDAFAGCGDAPLAPPTLSINADGERLRVSWAAGPEPSDPDVRDARAGCVLEFRVESSPEPGFGLPELVYAGEDADTEVWKPQSGALFFRAAATLLRRPREDGAPPEIVEESAWSRTKVFHAAQPQRWEVLPPAQADGEIVRTLHVAMLRFCAARSDCLAVLALPRHHREAEALAHAAELTARLGGAAEPGDAGARTLSFGALYHPWTVVRTPVAAAPLRAIPPDGATAGVMAARANDVGAWAAPANQPLSGVAILDPRLPESVRAAFLDRKVNAVAAFPRGFMTWSEETLSDDPELRGVGVRRLMILLRRLVLREGNTYVFEPNNAPFRRLVQRQFDDLLGGLYVRGAFAGATHAEGYRVTTDETVNPAQSVDQGRLIIELRVAPSRPLAFLTVRLVQSGAGLTVQEI